MRNKTRNSTRKRLSPQLETFCLEYFKIGEGKAAAIAAGYAPKHAVKTASRILSRPCTIERLKQLRQKAEDDSIMSVIERKQKLTKIARGNLINFINVDGDQSWINLDGEHEGSEAVAEIKSSTEHGRDGEPGFTVHTSVKLHDPIRAIDTLNKMDKLYSDGAQINIDNRQLNIIVRNQETANLIGQIPERKQLNGD